MVPEALSSDGRLDRVGEARLLAILDHAVEAIITIDESGICESFNPAAERMFGYRADEVIGKNVSLLMPSPFRDEHNSYLANYLKTGVRKIIGVGREVEGLKKDGTLFPIYLSVSEVRLGEERLFTGMLQDLTERKESQRRLVQSERLAAVGEALTGLAHESRNLLQKIQMALEFGRIEAEGQLAVEEQLNVIERASDDLRALLDEVRSYAAPIRLELSDEFLPELWREAWQSLERERSGRHATLREEITEVCLFRTLDRFRMVRVFRNLLENSLAACSDPVEVTIRVTESHSAEGRLLEIMVRDNGPGLTAEQKQRVFEPFFTTKAKGTGLGMAIAHRILEAHAGRIEVGQGGAGGAEFKIQLPPQ
jgi:PAS domain S-box-containing protein